MNYFIVNVRRFLWRKETHTPKKMCNVDAEYPYAHSYSTVTFIGKLSLGTQPDTLLTSNTKSLAYASLVRPVLEYGSACWDPCREGQITTFDCVQKKTAQFTNHTQDSDWEISA